MEEERTGEFDYEFGNTREDNKLSNVDEPDTGDYVDNEENHDEFNDFEVIDNADDNNLGDHTILL